VPPVRLSEVSLSMDFTSFLCHNYFRNVYRSFDLRYEYKSQESCAPNLLSDSDRLAVEKFARDYNMDVASDLGGLALTSAVESTDVDAPTDSFSS
jgi:hypothetical protein